MAHSETTERDTGRFDPALVGAVLTRLGLATLALAVPVAAGAFVGVVGTAGSPAAGVALALRAMEGPLLGDGGVAWLFHVATLVALCGCWLLGAGLLLEGLFD